MEVTIQTISPHGHGIGYLADNTPVHVLGAFIGDTVEVSVYKKAEGITYAEIVNITKPSPFRTHTPQQAPFFDANAPWQYLKFSEEQKIKSDLVHEGFLDIADTTISSEISGIPDMRQWHYRNKAAYSFLEQKGTLHFALYPRGIANSRKQIQQDNILVHEEINRVANIFLHFFNQKKVPLETLKYLILRYSYSTNTVVAHILVTESQRKKLPWKKSDLEQLIKSYSAIKGILVSQSEAEVRTASTVKDFYELGDITIHEVVGNNMYTYHPSQFFQIYPHAFETILKDCVACVTSIPNHKDYTLLDLFAGVGIIGLHLSSFVTSVHGVEQSPLSKEYAVCNAQLNGIDNFSYTEGNVDQLVSYIDSHQILVIDPPRSGLSSEVIERIRQVQPEYIIYISCNPLTQARDFNEIKGCYEISFSKTYNLFPHTSHIEHLIFLKRK